MRRSEISAVLQADIHSVWDIVTDNSNFSWRSDLERIDVSEGGRRFTEFTKNGFSTDFTVTVKEECRRYEFDMENRNMTGHWTGIFERADNGGTVIHFTEELRMQNPLMELLSHLFMNIGKMQRIFVADLKKALGEE